MKLLLQKTTLILYLESRRDFYHQSQSYLRNFVLWSHKLLNFEGVQQKLVTGIIVEQTLENVFN